MKTTKLHKKVKSSIKKHYVRKNKFKLLTKEVGLLKKQIAKLEQCCESVQMKKSDASEPVESTEISVEDAPQDKLTRIKGIGVVLEKKLHGLGISKFSQIAGWSEEDADKISEHLNFKGRIQREEWVKQAKDLM